MSRRLSRDLNDPDLFKENIKGSYQYHNNGKNSKSAYGSLKLSKDPKRSNKAQREAGGDARRKGDHKWGSDDGGHMIGTRFGGSPYEENLTAQNSNLNRQDFKKLEDAWAKHLKKGEGYNVFVNIETFGEDRPNAYMGYAIFEYPDGTRTYETYSFSNESRKEQEKWDRDLEEFESEKRNLHFYDSFDEWINKKMLAEEDAEDEEHANDLTEGTDEIPTEETSEDEEHASDLTEGTDEISTEDSEEQEQANDLTEGTGESLTEDEGNGEEQTYSY